MVSRNGPTTLEVCAVPSHGENEDPPREGVSFSRVLVVRIAFLLLVLSVVPWRSGSIFDGGIDPLDIVKGMIAVASLALAGGLILGTRRRIPLGIAPAAAVMMLLLIGMLGAIVAGNGVATMVVIVRMLIATATILLLLSAVPWDVGVAGILAAMTALALIAAVTGLPTYAAEGRLAGGIPQMHPNELAGLAGAPLVGAVVQILRRGITLTNSSVLVLLSAVVLGTGSRTGLVAIVASILVAVLVNGIRQRAVLFVLIGGLPVAYVVVAFTDVFQELATRAGSTDTTSSLHSRFDAWNVVLGWGWSSWQKWIGLGFSEKTVPVDIEWRDVQVLDSSWVSVLGQAGVLGALLLGGLVAWTVVTATVSVRRRPWVLPLLTLLLLRSVTESGLMDATLPFVMMMVLCTVLTPRSRHEDFAPQSVTFASAGAGQPRARQHGTAVQE